jgi:Na+/phosphate symporter
VLEQNRQAGQQANDLRDRHLARLQQGVPGAFEISPQHLDAIHILRDIHNHLAHLVAAMNEPGAESRGAPRLA